MVLCCFIIGKSTHGFAGLTSFVYAVDQRIRLYAKESWFKTRIQSQGSQWSRFQVRINERVSSGNDMQCKNLCLINIWSLVLTKTSS